MIELTHTSVVPDEQLVRFSPGISWAVLPGDGMTLVYWVFQPPECGEVPLHRHDIAQGGIVLEGALTLMYDDGSEETLRPGGFYNVARNVGHGARVTGRTVVLDIFVPNRPEYEARYAARETSAVFTNSTIA